MNRREFLSGLGALAVYASAPLPPQAAPLIIDKLDVELLEESNVVIGIYDVARNLIAAGSAVSNPAQNGKIVVSAFSTIALRNGTAHEYRLMKPCGDSILSGSCTRTHLGGAIVFNSLTICAGDELVFTALDL